MYSIRTSDRKTFRQCRQLWDFTSPIRRNLEPVVTSKHLVFGIAIHRGLEEYYEPEYWNQPNPIKANRAVLSYIEERKQQRSDMRDAMDDAQLTEFDELTELGRDMLYYYGDWAPAHDHFTPVAVEYDFQVPVVVPQGHTDWFLTDEPYNRGFDVDDTSGKPCLQYRRKPVMYEGRIDLILRENGTDALWIADHKTASRLGGGDAHLDIDTQVASYAWAMRELGKNVAGVIYSQLLKSAPSEPKVLKSGKLSKDKSQGTTYELYVEALEKHRLPHHDYEDFLEYLRTNPNEYVKRLQLHRSNNELDRQGDLIFMEAIEMVSEPFIYPNPHFMECNRCAFKSPCLVAQEKGDVEFVLSNDMVYKERE